MSIWGKLVGATAGFAVGGPIGALLGGVAGHFVVDEAIERASGETSADKEQVVFTIGVIALSAKMAKADGVVTHDEVKVFNQLFHVPPHERGNVRRVFDFARQDVAGFDGYAAQLRGLFGEKAPVLEDVLDGLFLIAQADGEVHPAEMTYLREVARIFGFDEDAFAQIKERHLGPDQSDPYVILGISRSAEDHEVKSAYRKLVKEHHPDVMIARGVPEEMIELATENLAAINTAYDKIAKKRGLN